MTSQSPGGDKGDERTAPSTNGGTATREQEHARDAERDGGGKRVETHAAATKKKGVAREEDLQ